MESHFKIRFNALTLGQSVERETPGNLTSKPLLLLSLNKFIVLRLFWQHNQNGLHHFEPHLAPLRC